MFCAIDYTGWTLAEELAAARYFERREHDLRRRIIRRTAITDGSLSYDTVRSVVYGMVALPDDLAVAYEPPPLLC